MRGVGRIALATMWVAASAEAAGPLENPDNGGAAFARGGAWLAVGTDPVAAHYNPAALATQRSAGSLDLTLNFNQVCYARGRPGDRPTGPAQGSNPATPDVVYARTCNDKTDFPRTIPAIAFSWRVSDRVGLGFAVVSLATYGTVDNEWPFTTRGRNRVTGETVEVPAPFRYQTLGSDDAVALPTISVGYEPLPGFRIGVGFISGFVRIQERHAEVSAASSSDQGDRAVNDWLVRHNGIDPFIPGFIGSAHWSASRYIDLAVWYRFIDRVRIDDAKVRVTSPLYTATLDDVGEVCDVVVRPNTDPNLTTACVDRSIENRFSGARIAFSYPQELRGGIRFHWPRGERRYAKRVEFPHPTRDPLGDDRWDIELDASYTRNSTASTFAVRRPAQRVLPAGTLAPNADRDLQLRDTFGLRLGGQWNPIRAKLGFMVGTWVETRALDDRNLVVSPVASLRGGYGGGIVLRQDAFDLHLAYQRHWNRGLDNRGDGAQRAPAGARDDGGAFTEGGPLGDDEFRTFHGINGGRVDQASSSFVLGALLRF